MHDRQTFVGTDVCQTGGSVKHTNSMSLTGRHLLEMLCV